METISRHSLFPGWEYVETVDVSNYRIDVRFQGMDVAYVRDKYRFPTLVCLTDTPESVAKVKAFYDSVQAMLAYELEQRRAESAKRAEAERLEGKAAIDHLLLGGKGGAA